MTLPQNSAKRRCLPPVPQLAHNLCDTFSQPPLDGSLCISEIYEWHAHNSPNHPLFQYLETDGSTVTISYKDALHAMHRGGWLLKAAIEAARTQPRRPIIAVLSLSESVSYTLTWLSAERAGFAIFPISPRNSPAAVAHLLTQVNVDLLLVGREPVTQDLANAAFEHLRVSNTSSIIPPAAIMLAFDDLLPTDKDEVELLPPIEYEADDISFILHSSGTTAFPKPIRWSCFGAVTVARMPYYGEINMTGMRMAVHSLPIYHVLGIIQSLWAGSMGVILVCNKPTSLSHGYSPSQMLRDAYALNCDLLTCTPNFAEAWAKKPEDVELLKRTRGLIFSGGPLGKETGDFLAANGVSIHQLYGSTECGTVNTMRQGDAPEDWAYISFAKQVNIHWVSDEGGSGTSRLVLTASEVCSPTVFNSMIDGVDAFNTNDLFIQHPTKPNLWKIYGRADDQITHSIGEKTNPGPLEAVLSLDMHIAHCLMFGRGQFNAGVLVEPMAEFKFNPQDEEKLAEFRNTIWPTVQKMNRDAPQHSRIFKEMILVTVPSKPFTYTAKGTPRRQAIITEYASEIEALYASVEESAQADLPAPRSWDIDQTSQFVRALVTNVIGHSLDDTEDFFQHGCDSLQATWIRNSLLHALRTTSEVDTRSIPFNFVYEHPTISRLATYLVSVSCPNVEEDKKGTHDSAIDAMHKMVDKYCGDFLIHNPRHGGVPDDDAVLVTGTTGGLGCAILSQLAESPEVTKVYALNRPAKQPLEERQRHSLSDRGYDADAILHSPKLVLLEADLVQPMLGLSQGLYDELRDSVTHIIHNAWPVNFNLNLGFFDPNIRSLRNLIDLSLRSPHAVPPHLLFISSIGVLRHTKRDQRIAEEFVGAGVAVGTGYSESKWVGEQLLAVASRDTPLPTISFRVGQIAGSDSGAWNVHEWVPSLIKSSIHLGCVPMFSANISWMNARTFASAILEARSTSTKLSPLHLVHPRPTSWGTLFEPIAKKYNLRRVSFSEWFTNLAASEVPTTQERHGINSPASCNDSESTSDILASNPALKLLSFFSECNEIIEKMAKENRSCKEAMALPYLDVTKCATAAAKQTFSEERLQPLRPEDMNRWVGYWQDVGYLPRT